MLGRVLRGAPEDILWRFNVEGPKLDIRIPMERVAGGLMLAMVVLFMITSSISGYDTSREAFPSEILRLAELSSIENNVNAVFRFATGFALIGAAAGLHAALSERGRVLSTMAAFGLGAAGVLVLVASAMQIVFVELADEYTNATGANRDSLLITARAIAMSVQHTTTAAFMAIVLSTYVLAVLLGRENLVPRWLIGIPIMSAALVTAGLIGEAAGVFDDGLWFVMISGVFLGIVWLLIAGLYLLLSSRGRVPAAVATEGAAP
jgi:hypothetical protein